jgi:NodT family efflux transporter outer membrane factor (OMF) lipoprotein
MKAGWYLSAIVWMLSALNVGCTSERALRTDPKAPGAFENRADNRSAAWPSKEWYRGFGSDQLNTLIETAAGNNWDLAAARARVAQADARARAAGAAILPSVDAAGNASFLAGHSGSGSGHETDWSALLSASYEVDFWGKNRATANSAKFLAVASRAQRDTLALTTLAGVADGYFQLLALRERVTIARSNLEAARGLLTVVQARYDAGSASPVELAAQKSALSAAALVIPELEQQEGEARAALALLVGHVPEGFDIEHPALDSLTEPVVAPGLPSELLTRRPDMFVAEANLQSAHADLAAARAAMLPSVNLTAAAGLQNPALNAAVLTVPGTGPTLALTGTLAQVIFDHGRLEAQRAEAQAKQEELLAAYRTAIASALIDVENALSGIQHLDAARPFQTENLVQAQRAFDGAKLRYQAGSNDYLTLLEAQRTLYGARDQFVQYRLARLQALVGLCKALGGGWTQSAPAAASVTQPGNQN